MSDSSAILSLFTSLDTNTTTSTLLSIISGQSTSGSVDTGNPILALDLAEQNETKGVAQTAQEPGVKMDVAAFTKAVTSAKSITQLLANPAFQKVFLTANNLSDQIGYTALVTKALMSDPSDSSSLAAQLGASESAWTSTAKAYDFFDKGLSAIQTPAAISALTNAYAEVSWRNSLDATTPGLSNALTFRSEASTITSVDQILGDPVMRDVVTTALGVPEQIAFQPLEAQEKAISSRLDISMFQDPHFVTQFVDQYLIAKQQSSISSSGTTSTSLFQLAAQSEGLTV